MSSETVAISLLCLSIVCTQLSMYLNNKTVKYEIDSLQRRISFLEMLFERNNN